MEDVHVRALEKKQYLSKKPASRFASAGLAVSGNKSFLILISRICQILEFFIRYLFVNIPTFVLASFPEINRISILCITYFLMQVMGICWAVLVNAGFALACRVTYILPEIRLDVASKLRISADVAGFSPSATSEVMASFYVFYASIRIMITFAQNVFTIALQSTQDFPDASKQIARGGMSSLTLTRAAFFPAIMLQLGLICADTVCMDIGDEDGVLATETLLSFQAVSQLRSKICEHFGFNFFTSPYANVRNLIFAVVLIMVLQTWQAYLQQFPRWNPVFQNMSSGARFGFQFSATILLLSTLTTLFAMCTDFIHGVIAERAVLLNMLGWTVWLMQFSSVLTENRGPEWIQTLTPKHIQHMLSYLRMSQCLLLIAMFAYKTLVYGLLQAQSELTFITLLLPALYCMVYLGSTALLNVQNDMRMLWSGVCFSFLTSVVITYGIAKTNAKGSLLMVFLHVMKKWVEMFEAVIASDADDYDLRGEYCDVAAVSDGPIPTDSLPATANSMCGNDSSTRGRPRLSSVPKEGNDASDRPSLLQSGVHQSPKKLFSFAKVQSGSACNSSPVRDFRQSPLSLPPLLSPSSSRSLKTAHRSRSFSALSQNVDGSIAQTPGKASPEDAQPRAVRRVSSASLLTGLDDSDSSDAVHGNRERALSITTRLLHERGQVNNPLVSLGIPDHVRKHWLLAVPKQNMTYLGNLSSWMTGGYVGNNPYAGTVRAFINLAMSLIVFLMVITVLATAQRSLSVYPKLLKFNLHSDVDASGQVQHYLHFDHKVSNVTLQLHPHTADLIYERAESVPSPRHHTCHHDCDVIGEEDSWNGHEVLGRFSNQRSFSHYEMQRELPYYMSCSWRWKGLSVLDFALLSQVAYFEDENHSLHGDGLDEIPSGARTFRVQQIVDALFPHDDFVATLSHANSSDVGPRFVEVHSDKLNLTIVAVRGTDVGRLSDIMEDFKLFAEPIIFKCLSTVCTTSHHPCPTHSLYLAALYCPIYLLTSKCCARQMSVLHAL